MNWLIKVALIIIKYLHCQTNFQTRPHPRALIPGIALKLREACESESTVQKSWASEIEGGNLKRVTGHRQYLSMFHLALGASQQAKSAV
jgi:hypothetical protein